MVSDRSPTTVCESTLSALRLVTMSPNKRHCLRLTRRVRVMSCVDLDGATRRRVSTSMYWGMWTTLLVWSLTSTALANGSLRVCRESWPRSCQGSGAASHPTLAAKNRILLDHHELWPMTAMTDDGQGRADIQSPPCCFNLFLANSSIKQPESGVLVLSTSPRIHPSTTCSITFS
jgi:hypothetical protein